MPSKRMICLVLCALLALSVLASCADDNTKNTNKTDDTSAVNEENTKKQFEKADFNGATFIICSPMDEASDFGDCYIDNEEMTGEPINDAVIKRNNLVEEKYNIDIIQRDEGTSYASQASKSGTVDFDLVYDWGIRLVPTAMEGVYYPLNNIPYVDLDQEYWAPSTQDDLTIADKLLIWTSDISMNRIGYAGFWAFNKELLDEYNIEYPYELVKRNEWTCDKMIELFSQIGQDVNGDTMWGVEDIYGVSGFSVGTVVNSSGLVNTFTLKDDRTGEYTVNVFSEKLQQIYEKYSKTLLNNDSICDLGWDDWIKGRDISKFDSQFQAGRVISFTEGHYAFAGTSMSYIPEFFGEALTFHFGVVPNPKYEASQTGYYHYIDTCSPMFAIPKQAQDMDKVGIILEYLSYQSMEKLLPAFYEQTIKTKCMSDPEGRDEEMLDIIRDNVYYSWTGLYYLGIPSSDGKTWDPIGTMYNEMMASGNFGSIDKKYHAAAQKSLDDMYDLILAMDLDK